MPGVREVSEYTIEQCLGVRKRMDLVAAVNRPATFASLDAIGVAPGARCLRCQRCQQNRVRDHLRRLQGTTLAAGASCTVVVGTGG